MTLVDATESPIELPQKAKTILFWKEKQHTLKTQLLVILKNGEIICLAFANGKKHDFRLFKDSRIHVGVKRCWKRI